ncbi:MAG: AAA family ATPase [bacterium]|nr:AAA family ATPase [bacterium]
MRSDLRKRWLEVLNGHHILDDEAGFIADGIGLGLTPEIRAVLEVRLERRFENLHDPVRASAVEYFARAGANDDKTHLTFEELLLKDRGKKISAAEYFAKISAEDEKTRAAIEMLLLIDSDVRFSALKHASRVRENEDKPDSAIEARRVGGGVRSPVAEYLAKIDASEKVQATSQRWLDDDDEVPWLLAVNSLTRIGASDKQTRDAVGARLNARSENVREGAIGYFAKIGAKDEKTRAAIKARLEDDDWFVRCSAVEYFAKIGADDEATRAAIEARLEDDDGVVRGSAIEYLAKIGANDEATRAAVEAKLEAEDWRVWRFAVEYLVRFGVSHEKTSGTVKALLTAPSESFQVLEVALLVEAGLTDGNANAVLDAFAGGAWQSIPWQTHDKLSEGVGRLAATDDLLLKRISEQPVEHFDLTIALYAAAIRRDELRRETPLNDVLAGRVPRQRPPAEPEPSPSEAFKITHLRVANLRVFDDLSVELNLGEAGGGQWTLLLGDNAVGKTTLLRVIALACIEEQTAAALLQLTGISAPFVRHETDQASVSVATPAGKISYFIYPNTTSERLDRQDPKPLPYPVFAYGSQRGTAFGGPDRGVDFKSLDNVGTLFDDNAYLIHAETWLREMRLAAYGAGSRQAFYESVCETLVAVLPGVETIELNEAGQVWLDGPKVGKAPLAAMSDGYVTTVGWIVDLVARWAERSRLLGRALDGDFRKEMTGLVLIDEIDLHLHPLWQVDIVSSLRRQFPCLSFVASTHNPLTLLGAGKGEILVLRRDPDNGRVGAHHQDIPPGTAADDVLTGEWFGLTSTLDHDTLGLLDDHRDMLRRGVAADDPGRKELESVLRRRLGTFPTTALDRIVHSIAAELIDDDFVERTPGERQKLRQKIVALAREKRKEQSA